MRNFKRAFLAFFLSQTSVLLATTYYVSNTGSGSVCTSATPCREIRTALTLVHPGDLISVGDGSYKGFDVDSLNGTAANPITIKAQGSNAEVMKTTDRSTNQNRDTIYVTFSSYIIIDGFRSFNATRAALRVDQSPNITVRNCVFGNNTVWGMFCNHSNDTLIENNEFYGSVQQHGMYFSNSADRPIIRGNRSHDNGGCGIHMNGDLSAGQGSNGDDGNGIISGGIVENNVVYNNGTLGGAGINMDGVQDTIVRNNLLYNNHASGITAFQQDGAAGPKGDKIYGNTVDMASGSRWGIGLTALTGTVEIKDNILINRGSHGAIHVDTPASTAKIDSDYNIFGGANSNVATPDDDATTWNLSQWQASKAGRDANSSSVGTSYAALWVNSGAGDYHLKNDTAAGKSFPELPTDLEGNARSNPPDMGALEFISGGGNQAPTVAQAASASPNPVLTNNTNLSVLGADDGGEGALTYTWATTGNPPAAVSFSINGTNQSKNTNATFTKAGSYDLQVTIKDTPGRTVTSNVTVTVNQTFTSIVVTPASASVPAGTNKQFAASGKDQFGNALTSQPSFGWSFDPLFGTVNASGLFTAGNSAGGPLPLTAQSGTISAAAQVTILTPPTVANPAAANPNPVTGTTANLTVLGADDKGEPALIYTWATTGTPPAAVTFSPNGTNAAKSSLATFTKPGTYNFLVTIKDGDNLTVTSALAVTVNQTVTTIAVTPASASVPAGTTKQFAASAKDQFGTTFASQPTFTWSVDPAAGTINASGLFTAGNTAGGPLLVTAQAGGVSGTAQVTVITPPTVATPAASNPNPVTGTTANLTVLGADDKGEAALIYTWATTGTPPASVSFSVNGTNASKNTTATFTKAGAYNFQVTIKDGDNFTVTSALALTVNQTVTTIAVTPTPVSVQASVPPNVFTKQFSASSKDQFGATLSPQPSYIWEADAGAGTIDSAGLLTSAAQAGGPFDVRAKVGTVIGIAKVTITAGAPNRPPVVTLTKPINNDSFTLPTNITITASASDPDAGDSVTKVDFYAGSTLLGSDNTSPFAFVWTNATAGPYQIRAVATDTHGLTAQDQATILIKDAPPNDKSGGPSSSAPLTKDNLIITPDNPAQFHCDGAGSVEIRTMGGEKVDQFEFSGLGLWQAKGVVSGTYMEQKTCDGKKEKFHPLVNIH